MVHCQTYARLLLGGALTWATVLPAAQHSRQGIRHAFLATGAKTYIISHTGKQLWSYPRPTREGWMLPSGNVLLVLARARNFPGSVIEVGRRKRVHFQYRGKQHGGGGSGAGRAGWASDRDSSIAKCWPISILEIPNQPAACSRERLGGDDRRRARTKHGNVS